MHVFLVLCIGRGEVPAALLSPSSGLACDMNIVTDGHACVHAACCAHVFSCPWLFLWTGHMSRVRGVKAGLYAQLNYIG